MDALEARVAFHVHRLGLNGTALREITGSRADAADLAAARVTLTSADVEQLARQLGIEPLELVRDLQPGEREAWAFYMRSAAFGPEMWSRAVALAENNGLSRRDVGEVLRIDRRNLARALSGTSRVVFTQAMADALGETLQMDVRQILSRNRE